MTLNEIKTNVENGRNVFWKNPNYPVIKDSLGQWLIKEPNGGASGLTWTDGVTLSRDEKDFKAAPKLV